MEITDEDMAPLKSQLRLSSHISKIDGSSRPENRRESATRIETSILNYVGINLVHTMAPAEADELRVHNSTNMHTQP